MSEKKDRSWLSGVIAIIVSNFIFCCGFYALESALPLYVSSLGANDQQIGLVSTGFFTASVVTRIFLGMLVEKLGRKKILHAGVISSVVIMLLYQLTHTSIQATVVRILQGIGYGMVTTMFGSIAADLLPPEKRGEGIGYLSMSTTLAASFAPGLALKMIDWFSFMVMFLVAAIMMAIASVAVYVFVKVPADYKTQLPVGEDGKVKRPPIWKSFYDPRVTAPMIAILLWGITRSSEQTFLPMLVKTYALTALAIFHVIKPWIALVCKFVTGKMYDKKGPTAAILTGGGAMFICLVMYSFTRTNAMLLTAAIFSGIAIGMIVPAFQAYMMELVGKNKSLGNALFYNAVDLGAALGGLIMGKVSSYTGYAMMFRICSGLMVIYFVIIIAHSISKKRKENLN